MGGLLGGGGGGQRVCWPASQIILPPPPHSSYAYGKFIFYQFIFILRRNINLSYVNSVDPDQTPRFATSDLVLCYLWNIR